MQTSARSVPTQVTTGAAAWGGAPHHPWRSIDPATPTSPPEFMSPTRDPCALHPTLRLHWFAVSRTCCRRHWLVAPGPWPEADCGTSTWPWRSYTVSSEHHLAHCGQEAHDAGWFLTPTTALVSSVRARVSTVSGLPPEYRDQALPLHRLGAVASPVSCCGCFADRSIAVISWTRSRASWLAKDARLQV